MSMRTASLLATSESNVPTSQMAIDDFVKRHGITLPDRYISFLLTTNGGQPHKLVYPISGLPLNPFGDLHFFMGLAPQWPLFDLNRYLAMFGDRIPAAILPIAVNSGSDYICLDLRGGGQRVVFWDHGHFWSTGEWREADLYLIADTFEDFLKSLRPSPY